MATVIFKQAGIGLETYLKDGIPMLYVDQIFTMCKMSLEHLVKFNDRYETDNLCPAEGDPEDRGYYVGAQLYDVHEYLVGLRTNPFQSLLRTFQTSLLKVISGYWVNIIYDDDFTPTLTIRDHREITVDDEAFVVNAAFKMIALLQAQAEEFDYIDLARKGIYKARTKTVGPNLLVNILMWYIPRTSGGAAVLSRVREIIWAIQKTNQTERSLFTLQWAIADLLSLEPEAYEDLDLLEVELFTGILMVLREFTNG